MFSKDNDRSISIGYRFYKTNKGEDYELFKVHKDAWALSLNLFSKPGEKICSRAYPRDQDRRIYEKIGLKSERFIDYKLGKPLTINIEQLN